METSQSKPLFIKYIPTQNDFTSRTLVTSSLKYILNSSGKAQSIFIQGDSGVGKTTLSRLIAEKYLGVSDLINLARTSLSPIKNFKEVDMRCTTNKKEFISLLSELSSHTGNSWKVYLLDECDLCTKNAQLTLASVIASLPKNVLVVLCTANQQRVEERLMEACELRISISPMCDSDLRKLLYDICRKEEKDFDMLGLEMLVKLTNHMSLKHGFIREALLLLDNVLTERGSATLADVQSVLNSNKED